MAVAALPVAKPPEGEQLLEGTDESHDSHTPRLTVRQRHGKLFNELDLSSLDSWAPKLADATCWLLAEYHDVFSLDPVVRLYPFHGTYNKGHQWHSLQGTV